MRKFITLTTCIAIFYNIFTPIRLLVDGGKSIFLVISFLTIFLGGNLLFNRGIWNALLYIFVVCVLSFIGVEYFSSYLPTILLILFFVFFVEYYSKTKDLLFAKWVIITTYLSVLFLVLVSIPQFIISPNLSRMVASEISTGESSNIGTAAYWTISYETIHNLPLLIIPVVVWMKNTTITKYRYFASLIVISFLILSVFADATTPLILIFCSVAIVYLYQPQRDSITNISRLLIISVVLVVLFNKSTLTTILETIQPVFSGSSNEAKVSELITYMNYGEKEGDLAIRDKVYNITLNSISDNFFGVEYDIKRIGRHSFILDHFAAMGFFLFMSFVIFLYYVYKIGASVLKQTKFAYRIAFVVFLLTGLLKNFFLINSILAIIPLSLVLIEKNGKYNIRRNG